MTADPITDRGHRLTHMLTMPMIGVDFYRLSIHPWRYDDMLPEILGRAGYQTHCIGKTHFFPQRAHLGFQSLESYEGDQNFDNLYVNDYHEWLREQTNGRLAETAHGVDWNSWYARPSHLPEELHNNTWVVTRALEFLRRRDRTRPLFLNLSFHRPHPTIDPPRVFYDEYRDAALPAVPVGDWAAAYDAPPADINAWHGRLAPLPAQADRLALWRQRLIEILAARPEDGLSDGRRLLSGRNLPPVRPELLT